MTEAQFRDAWANALAAYPRMSQNGWYDPPPRGFAVLAGTDTEPARVTFDSLRWPHNWPSGRSIHWKNGLLYAYSSPVCLDTGLAGDFGLTLYFGERSDVREHFLATHQAAWEVIHSIVPGMSSRELYMRSETVFRAYGLANAIESRTDVTAHDLGHTLPRYRFSSPLYSVTLPPEIRQHLSETRQFINQVGDWELTGDMQITIEPQLRSLVNDRLPQVSFHYVIAVEPFAVLAEGDEILAEHGLLTR